MIGHHTRFQENDYLPQGRGQAVKKKLPFFMHVQSCFDSQSNLTLCCDTNQNLNMYLVIKCLQNGELF